MLRHLRCVTFFSAYLSNHSVAVVSFYFVIKYEEIMTNDDNLESNLLTSSLLKMSGLHAGTK